MAGVSSPAPVDHGHSVEEPRQGARRYPRTFGGLIGSLIVAVAVVVGYWVAQNLTHDAGTSITPVHYLSQVATVQQAQVAGEAGDLKAVYPTSIPQGWSANSSGYVPGKHPQWRLGFLTGSDTFIGIAQAHDTVAGMVSIYVDKHAVTDATVHHPTAVGDTWRTFSDSGGDHAYALRLGDYTLLVYGSADSADFDALLSRLTQQLLPSATSSALVPDGTESAGS
jgi:hypothetical protein